MLKDLWNQATGGRKFYTGRRSFKLGPVRVNTVWFKPTSVSIGNRGRTFNVGTSGRKRTSLKIPGIGGTWQKTWGGGKKRN